MASITVKIATIPTRSDSDTIASYNVYSNQPSANTLIGTMTPAEAAVGKAMTFSDGVIHSVTSKAVWTTAGESTISTIAVNINTTGGSTVLYEELFTGTTLSWDTTNVTSNVAFSQNNLLTLTPAGVTAQTTYSSGIRDTAVTIPITTVITFDVSCSGQTGSNDSDWYIGLNKSTNPLTFTDMIGFTNSGTAGRVAWINYRTGQTTVASSAVLSIATTKTIKLIITATELKCYYWNGSAWTQLGTTIAPTSGFSSEIGATYYSSIGCGDSITNPNTVTVDNFRVLDTDFSTQYPA